MVLDIASELVHEHTNFMPFDKAQELAEIVLNRIEKEGMLPPFNEEEFIFSKNEHGIELANGNQWEPEE